MTETVGMDAYLAEGGVLTGPANVPPRYRAEIVKLMASFVDSELAGAKPTMRRRGPGSMICALSVFDYPLAGWTDAVTMNLAMGLAAIARLGELARVSYRPLAEAFAKIAPVEDSRGQSRQTRAPRPRTERLRTWDWPSPRRGLAQDRVLAQEEA